MVDVKPSTCAACGQRIRSGKGWMRDDEGRQIHLQCPASICPVCSRTVSERTRAELGRAIHGSCLKRQQAREAAARTKGMRKTKCAVCGRSLTKGSGGVMFQGGNLVHIACWRAPRA
jgi:hypothetical protein